MWSFLTPIIILALVGGAVGSLRAYTHAKQKDTFGKAIVNMLVGLIAAAWVADRFVPPGTPFTALLVGLMAGALGARVMDALDALVPMAVRSLLLGWLHKAGGINPADEAQQSGGRVLPPTSQQGQWTPSSYNRRSTDAPVYDRQQPTTRTAQPTPGKFVRKETDDDS